MTPPLAPPVTDPSYTYVIESFNLRNPAPRQTQTLLEPFRPIPDNGKFEETRNGYHTSEP